MRYLFFLLVLSGCAFAPSFDSTVNSKLAEVEVHATDLKTQCLALTPQVVHQQLEVPMLEIQAMTKYRTNSSLVNTGASGILKEIVSFEDMFKKEQKPSVAYCADKLDDISMTVDALLKPYGTLVK